MRRRYRKYTRNYKYRKNKDLKPILFLILVFLILTYSIIEAIKSNPIPAIIGVTSTIILTVTFIVLYCVIKNKKENNTTNSNNNQKQQNTPPEKEDNKIEQSTTTQTINQNKSEITYTAKQHYLSNTEQNFYNTIRNITEDQYITLPQVPLSQIVEKQSNYKYQNELYRVVDICIFEKKTYKPLLCIEINDETHHQKNRYMRDLKVKEILRQAGIPLIILWTEYGVNVEYIKKRINEHIRLY